jgi:hypothetical protein
MGDLGERLTRRMFVTWGAAAAGGVLLGAKPASAAAANPLARSTYAPLVGQTFTLSQNGASVSAVLDSIDDLTSAPAGKADSCFSVVFTSAAGSSLPEGISTVAHRRLGAPQLFLAPVDRGATAQHFQAVVNRP